jgi:hypothetical protein
MMKRRGVNIRVTNHSYRHGCGAAISDALATLGAKHRFAPPGTPL